MKKKLTIMMFFIMLVGSLLAGCSSGNSDQASDNAGDGNSEGGVVQLTFWRNAGNDVENKVYEDLIKGFEEQNPNIKVKMTPIPFGDYETKLRTALAAGNPPDVMAIDSPNLAAYADAGAIKSIDEYMKSEGNVDDILEGTLSGMKYNDEIYLAPIVESGIAMFYNKNLFEEKGVPFPSEDPNNPWTWEQVLEAAKKLNDPANGVYGIDPAQGFGDGEGPAYFKMPILWQFGAEVLSQDGTTADGYLNSPEAIEALQFYQDLYEKHKVAAVELPPDPFATGKVAISMDGTWALAHLKNNFPDFKLGEDFGIAPLPKAKQKAAPNGGWALGIASKSEHPEEAWKLIQYITSYEGIKTYAEATGDIPARYSVAEDMPELNEYPKNIFVTQAQNYAENRPVTPAYPTVSKAMKELFEDIGISGRNVEAAAAEAVEKIDKEIKKTQN